MFMLGHGMKLQQVLAARLFLCSRTSRFILVAVLDQVADLGEPRWRDGKYQV
jgi:hypothetical protein